MQTWSRKSSLFTSMCPGCNWDAIGMQLRAHLRKNIHFLFYFSTTVQFSIMCPGCNWDAIGMQLRAHLRKNILIFIFSYFSIISIIIAHSPFFKIIFVILPFLRAWDAIGMQLRNVISKRLEIFSLFLLFICKIYHFYGPGMQLGCNCGMRFLSA